MSDSGEAIEMSRPVRLTALTQEPHKVEATAEERAALAERFDLVAISKLTAEIQLTPDGTAIDAEGFCDAKWTQLCAVSGEELPMSAREELSFHFVPADQRQFVEDEEVELEAADCDDIEYRGDSFDLGEAVAQSFGLAIDPFATGPDAERVRREKGIEKEGRRNGPLADLLAGLKTD